MLLVKDSMSRELSTITLSTTAAEALALCREKRVRHLPVVEDGRLVGLVSDRDLRSATPALGDPDRAEALRMIRAADCMIRDVVTALPEDPIEQAAKWMRERGVGCLPITEGGELAGILTTSDVVDAMTHLIGAYEPGSRLEISMPERPGALAEVAEVFREHGIRVLSVLASPASAPRVEDSAGERIAVFRLETIDPTGIVKSLHEAGFTVHWPLGMQGNSPEKRGDA